MDSKERAKIIKTFIVIYLISFILINWNDVSWLFNYKEIFGLIDDFFTPYPSINVSFPTNVNSYSNYRAGTLEIPAIGIYAPIIFPKSADKNSLTKDLDNGAVYYPGSVLPGQEGEIIILGHSAPLNWPKIKYDWVFSKLNDLKSGDEIIINFENKRFIYIVNETKIIKKNEEVSLEKPTEDSNLLLVSCWPPGKDSQRIVVKALLPK